MITSKSSPGVPPERDLGWMSTTEIVVTYCKIRLGDTGLEPVTSCVSRIGLNRRTDQEEP